MTRITQRCPTCGTRDRDARGKCRECNRRRQARWLARNQDVQKARTKVCRDQRIRTNLRYVWDYKQEHPCVDCGNADPRVLQFDHTADDKVAGVAAMIRSRTLGSIIVEIAKCEVVCANCHQIRTAQRAGWWKLLGV